MTLTICLLMALVPGFYAIDISNGKGLNLDMKVVILCQGVSLLV